MIHIKWIDQNGKRKFLIKAVKLHFIIGEVSNRVQCSTVGGKVNTYNIYLFIFFPVLWFKKKKSRWGKKKIYKIRLLFF